MALAESEKAQILKSLETVTSHITCTRALPFENVSCLGILHELGH